MKRKLAWIGAILAGLYLLTAGPVPDPIPFIDEGVAIAILLKCTMFLGYDLRKWLPFFAKSAKSKPVRNNGEPKGVTIDL